MVLRCAFLWGLGAVFAFATWVAYAEDLGVAAVIFGLCMTTVLVTAPLFGYSIRHRPDAIRSPRLATYNGSPSVYFPADRMAHPVSETMYPLLAAILLSWASMSDAGLFTPLLVVVGPAAALFLSYTVFAVTGRFAEDGTHLTEQGVHIRARGLRADVPWSSIAGSRTYKTWPFPYERIAIDLHPGSLREVSVTVPWWIGSPRPRRDTLFLTKVQVPGFEPGDDNSNPGSWISVLAGQPPTAARLRELGDPPELIQLIYRTAT